MRTRSAPLVLAAVSLGLSVAVGQASGVRITSPAPGARITGSVAVVQGEAPPNAGVTVNDNPGMVEGGRFVAVIPVDATVRTLTVVARDFTGVLGTDSVRVTVQSTPGEDALRLTPVPRAGAAPMTVQFRLRGLTDVRQFSLDADGDGRPDAQGSTLAGATFTYSRPGIYAATLTVTDTGGASRSAVGMVQVSDSAALDARLQFVWSSLKTALRSGNVARAVEFLHSDTREVYRQDFDRMSPATLANIDQTLTTIRLVQIGFAGAEYSMLRRQDGKTLSYAVWFQLDRDGLWR
ncbi:MAG: hypothetical protein ACREK4_17745, partial [Candidatus Rokuibacteriota bacterium]